MPLCRTCLMSRATQPSGDAACWLSVHGEIPSRGPLPQITCRLAPSWRVMWLRRTGGQRWHGEGLEREMRDEEGPSW